MEWKYFVLYCHVDEGQSFEVYLKGRSMEHLEERIKRYSNGMLSTTKCCIFTSNISHCYLREVNPAEFPHLTKRDFGIINENGSWNISDIRRN